jgi:geranylgeranyl reductase family protein
MRMAPESCDVLVVGGGPGGSTCARALTRAGLDVLVIDKQTFPRDKTCAGWVTPAVLESLEFDTTDYAQNRVLQPITGFRTGVLGAEETETHYARPVSYGIRRCEFDDYLLRRSGARLRLGETVKSMERENGGWLVNGAIRTPLIVGAGGNFCPVARMLRNENGRAETLVVAQEIEFKLPAAERAACDVDPAVPQFYFCRDLAGYGWCFAKGDYLNIGLGREDSHRLSSHVEQFVDWLKSRGRIPQTLPGKFNGHAYLLHPASRRNPLDDGVLLVGDALGLAYARSGEGIRPAVESGMLAAEVVVEARGDYRRQHLESYAQRMTERFGSRSAQSDAAQWLPAPLRQTLAARLLANSWFARNVVIDRWFLHAQQPALRAPAATALAA